MKDWIEADMVLIVLTSLALLGMSRLRACIRIVAVQGIVLGLFPLFLETGVRPVLLAAGTVTLKGFVFPWLLQRALRAADVRREVEPFVGYGSSLVVGVLALAASFWLGARLPLPSAPPSTLIVPVAFFGILVGLFLIVSRRKALTQVVGFLVMENGIYVFGVAFAGGQPLLIELGILLDVFVAVFIMGIAIFHISREFDHIDADRLSTLRDWTRRWRKA